MALTTSLSKCMLFTALLNLFDLLLFALHKRLNYEMDFSGLEAH